LTESRRDGGKHAKEIGRPCGTLVALHVAPGVETPGYFQLVSPRRKYDADLNDQAGFAQILHKLAVVWRA